jgi:hypothetical protein
MPRGNTVSVLHTLYRGTLVARVRYRQWDRPCATTMLVCLPPDAARTAGTVRRELRARLAGRVHLVGAVLDAAHFPVWRRPDRIERPLLLAGRDVPPGPMLGFCAGGPIGLLDLATTGQRLLPLAVATYTDWVQATAGAPAARPWWLFLDRHISDPDRYPLSLAAHEFAAQPQIAAMLHHDAIAIDTGDRFDGDCYGPGLTALATGAATYAEYLAGVLTFAGGLITLDGDLLVPSFIDVLVEQSLPERAAYHQQARSYLAAADPRTVLVAVTCHR